jgi:hypothetical protein
MDDPDAEILLETTRIGHALEVRAISGGDGLEVSFQAPASAIEADIHRLARAKLSFVRHRSDAGSHGSHAGSDEPLKPSKGRGGVIV